MYRLIAVGLLAPSCLFAQAPDSTHSPAPVFALRPIIVQATTAFATAGGASALAVRPDSMQLPPAPTLEHVLRELPFIQVRTNARGEGHFALRGSGFDAREVAVLIDGVPVSLGFDHRADLSMLPASGAYAVTMVRGIPSLLYGPNVLGGVVDVAIAHAPAVMRGTLSAGYDDNGTRALHGTGSVARDVAGGSFALRAGGGYRNTDGFPLPRDVREPAPYEDDQVRLNSDRIQSDGFITAPYASHRGAWASLTGLGSQGERGAPAELNVTNPRFWRYPGVRRTLGIVSLGSGQRASPLGGSASAQVSAGYDRGRVELNSYTNRTYSTILDREDDADRNVTGRVLLKQSITQRGDVSTAFTFADVERKETLTPGSSNAYRQRLWSGALETSWRIARARLSGGIAYDAADTPASSDKPAVGRMDTWGARVGVVSAVRQNLLVHAGAARRARFPALRELYGGALRMFEPNPALRHEVLVASEAGATLVLKDLHVQSVFFHHRIEDQIVRSTTPTRKVQRINRDQTRSTGVELLATTRMLGATFTADVTAQSVASTNPVNDTDFRPEYQPKWAGGARLIAPLPFGVRVQTSARMTGAQYCQDNAGVYTRLDRGTRFDARLSRAWRGLEVAIAGDNIGDAAIYDQCGLPQVGRVLRLQVGVTDLLSMFHAAP
jgi:iron complex outermembrane recepter protein